MSIDKVPYMGLPNCVSLSNGDVELIVTTDVGPRILSYATEGGENVFGHFLQSSKETALGTWKPYGGHRLWVWPEVFPATYASDNDPIEWVQGGELSILLRQPIDSAGMEKQIRITMASSGTKVVVEHTITSHNLWPIDMAVWAISVVQVGTSILPRVPFKSHDEYVPVSQPIAVCAFTDLQDPRFTLGPKYILLRADPALATSQKLGLRNKEGWCAHHFNRTLFVKRFQHDEKAEYPDYGVNNEVYVEGSFQELELLGPRRVVPPGESLSLTEEWELFENIEVESGPGQMNSLDAALLPLLQGFSKL